MPGIDITVIQHSLNADPKVPAVRQRKRVMGKEREEAARAEVEKLLKAGFIRKVLYTKWLSNVVLVKKANGKWRMCVDFTNLNKVCPKDFYPLPSIDKLVMAIARSNVMSFLDAFSGYNQIQMNESDQEKTSFITSTGTFCYRVMPFGLKHAGATFQRMIDEVFKGQLSRNVEAYVDDIVVRSDSEEEHLRDLEETFNTLDKFRIKLNPEKCVFGVTKGKFLGFIVGQRGIEVDPEKTQSVLDLPQPTSIKDVQALNGRLTALGRFCSKLQEKSLPFFNVLKKEQTISTGAGVSGSFRTNQADAQRATQIRSTATGPGPVPISLNIRVGRRGSAYNGRGAEGDPSLSYKKNPDTQ